MEEICLFYGHLVYSTDIEYNLLKFDIPIGWLLGIFSLVLVSINDKNLAILF
jgi:uncharacterized membrane protein AbrB (regulator of aidB expression)